MEANLAKREGAILSGFHYYLNLIGDGSSLSNKILRFPFVSVVATIFGTGRKAKTAASYNITCYLFFSYIFPMLV